MRPFVVALGATLVAFVMTGVGLVAFTQPQAAPTAQAPSWHLTATVAESCSCTVSCPCNFGGSPNVDRCDGNRLISIKADTTALSISPACRSSSRSRCASGRRSARQRQGERRQKHRG